MRYYESLFGMVLFDVFVIFYIVFIIVGKVIFLFFNKIIIKLCSIVKIRINLN